MYIYIYILEFFLNNYPSQLDEKFHHFLIRLPIYSKFDLLIIFDFLIHLVDIYFFHNPTRKPTNILDLLQLVS